MMTPNINKGTLWGNALIIKNAENYNGLEPTNLYHLSIAKLKIALNHMKSDLASNM